MYKLRVIQRNSQFPVFSLHPPTPWSIRPAGFFQVASIGRTLATNRHPRTFQQTQQMPCPPRSSRTISLAALQPPARSTRQLSQQRGAIRGLSLASRGSEAAFAFVIRSAAAPAATPRPRARRRVAGLRPWGGIPDRQDPRAAARRCRSRR